MSRLTEIEDKWGDNHEELIFPCDCGDGDYLRITWDVEDPEWRVLWVEAYGHRKGLWKRIKGAWRILRDQSWQHTEILLTPEVCEELGHYLLSKTTTTNDEIQAIVEHMQPGTVHPLRNADGGLKDA